MPPAFIYNSRNYSILLNESPIKKPAEIYNSRNYSILLNPLAYAELDLSTTVEIILYYLTHELVNVRVLSTTVEIILYYLTV